MSGRPKRQVFVYATDGSYIQKFESENDFRRAYYPDDVGKRPIFAWNELGYDYHLNLSYEIMAFRERPGREKVKLILAIHQSEFCKDTDYDETPVQVFNLKGELIAEFRSQRILKKFAPNKYTTAHQRLSSTGFNNVYKVTNPPGGLFFRYKKVLTDGTET